MGITQIQFFFQKKVFYIKSIDKANLASRRRSQIYSLRHFNIVIITSR